MMVKTQLSVRIQGMPVNQLDLKYQCCCSVLMRSLMVVKVIGVIIPLFFPWPNKLNVSVQTRDIELFVSSLYLSFHLHPFTNSFQILVRAAQLVAH